MALRKTYATFCNQPKTGDDRHGCVPGVAARTSSQAVRSVDAWRHHAHSAYHPRPSHPAIGTLRVAAPLQSPAPSSAHRSSADRGQLGSARRQTRKPMTLGKPALAGRASSLAYRRPLKAAFSTADSLANCRRANRYCNLLLSISTGRSGHVALHQPSLCMTSMPLRRQGRSRIARLFAGNNVLSASTCVVTI